MKPGGTFIRRRLMSPKVTASRWKQIASSGHPSISLRLLGDH